MTRDLDTSRRPMVLIWEVTQACDLACEHCRADAQSARHPGDPLASDPLCSYVPEGYEADDGATGD